MSRFYLFFYLSINIVSLFLEIGIGVGGVRYITEALKVNTTLTVFELRCE